MNVVGFKALLKSKADKVWSDFIPEKSALPAVVFTHIADGSSRVLGGSKVNKFDTWRVIIVAEKELDCKTISDSISTLDNTNNSSFKNVFVISDGKVPSTPEDTTYSYRVDFKTYDR